MTDNEIKKALECCTGIINIESCSQCPACVGCADCVDILREESLSLINRQQAEIETAKAELKETTEKFNCQQYVYTDLSDIIREKNAEIERLKINLKAVLDERADHSEAIKEFANEFEHKILHKEFWNDHPYTSQVWLNGYEQCMRDIRVMLKDKLKEMVGDTE
jgi:hypothetical protein